MRKSITLFFILYNYISLEMEETSLLLLVWTMLLIILFILFLYTFSSSFKELWGALVTGTFGKQSQKPQVFILINNYRVTHKEWDFRNDFTDFFLHLGFLEGRNCLIFVLNHLVNQLKKILNWMQKPKIQL